jgi:exosortase D (VPLPA-CTERM-specific)
VASNRKAEYTDLKFQLGTWLPIFALSFVIIFLFYDGLNLMVSLWLTTEEYGYGFLIPAISVFLIWQKKNEIEKVSEAGSWLGLLLTLFGLALFFLGELSTLFIIVQYAFVVVVAGVALSLLGRQGFRIVMVPILLLIFMIPLPVFLYQSLSSELQLISSQLGVAVIRLFNISVYLEGNVIDLGTYKLQVVEACSGLRYLFPLASLAFIAAYIFRGAFWKKAIIFLSSIPITVIMNSFRIGIIGVLVEYQGPSAAEGFLHYFEGWVIFMACMAVLIGEMWLLSRVGQDRRPFAEAFNVDFPSANAARTRTSPQTFVKPFVATSFLVVCALPVVFLFGERSEISPDRTEFAAFPMSLGEWQGKRGRIEDIYLDVLKLDDYLMADFARDKKDMVNFYVAYYASQKKGESAHSPRTCIPGGGWQIKDITQQKIDVAAANGAPINVNRVIIQKGERRQLVYYWFQQRGRNITNEYLVKWYIFWDALTRNRTDGALVRLTTFAATSSDLGEADKVLTDFSRTIATSLGDYVPE